MHPTLNATSSGAYGLEGRGHVNSLRCMVRAVTETSPKKFLEQIFPPPHRRDVYRAYALGWTDDGHPGKLVDGRVREHPLYPCYVIQDLMAMWAQNERDGRYLRAAELVADAAIRRMEDAEGGALVYWHVGWIPGRREPVLSALTQARYLMNLQNLGERTGRADFVESARRMMCGLMIPTSRGGVLLERPYGPVLEEFPNTVPVYVLNGWTTALCQILAYADRVNDDEAREFGLAGCKALVTLISRFDVPELANTRYSLAGPVWLRLQPDDTEAVRFVGGAVTLPADGTYEFVTEPGDRWQNWYDPSRTGPDGRIINPGGPCDVNVVLSRSADVAHVRFDLEVAQDTSVVVQLPTGEYDPMDSGMLVSGWKDHSRVELAGGRQSIDITVGMDEFQLVGYPTNFRKEIAGKFYNGYHWAHCANVRRLLEATADVRLVSWLVRWVEYLARWYRMPIYRDDARLELRHIPNGGESYFFG